MPCATYQEMNGESDLSKDGRLTSTIPGWLMIEDIVSYAIDNKKRSNIEECPDKRS